MTNTSIVAMSRIVGISLAELKQCLADAKDHPKISLHRGISEAETLSRAADRLCALIEANPSPKAAKEVAPAVDVTPIIEALERLHVAATTERCNGCGGVVLPDTDKTA